MAVAFGPTSCYSVLVLKSKLLHNPEVQSGFVPKRSHHSGKNIALRAEKPFFALRSFFSGAQRSGVFASEDVLRCVAMCGDVVACAGASCVPIGGKRQSRAAHRHKAMTAAQKLDELRHQQRGFSCFCEK